MDRKGLPKTFLKNGTLKNNIKNLLPRGYTMHAFSLCKPSAVYHAGLGMEEVSAGPRKQCQVGVLRAAQKGEDEFVPPRLL